MATKGGALPQAIKNLAERIQPSWVNGRWREAEISARKRAKLRKDTLLAGGEWLHDPPRKEMKTRMKGHKHDREAVLRQTRIQELMEKMPSILADWRKRKGEKKKSEK